MFLQELLCSKSTTQTNQGFWWDCWTRCFNSSKYALKTWLKNILLCLCVLLSRFWVVNSHLVLIQVHFILYLFWKKCFLKKLLILVNCFELSIYWKVFVQRLVTTLSFLSSWLVETTNWIALSVFQRFWKKLCFLLSFLWDKNVENEALMPPNLCR